jgi:hypothetical protein
MMSTMRRGQSGIANRRTTTEEPVNWEVTLADGAVIRSFHPPMLEGCTITWAHATPKTWGEARNSYMIAITCTAEGVAGILITHHNSCKQHATVGGCHRWTNCHFSHFPPGSLV